MEKRRIDKSILLCKGQVLNTTEASLVDRKKHVRKPFSYSHYFIDNCMFIVISFHFYCYFHCTKY